MHQRPVFTIALASILAVGLLAACAPQESGGAAGAGETFAGLPRVAPEAAGMSSERLDRIRPAFESFVLDGKLSGVVTVVSRGGQVVHVEASGHQDVEAGEPMTEDTIFRMYSMTKPIASAALMILWEEGHFLLSTPLAQVLPEFADTQVYVSGDGDDMETEPPRRPIVIRDLMTHTSGLTYTFIPSPVAASYAAAGLEGSADAVPHDDLAHYVRDLAKQPLLVHPGTAWNYSVGLEVAGRVVEVVSGQSFRDFLKERIFDPLGMVDTDFHVPDEKLDRLAVNYAPTPEGGIAVFDDPETSAYRRAPKVEMGGSGLVATAGDYLRFAQMLANGGELDGARILGTQTVALMMDNHLGSAYGPSPMSSLNLDMGMSEGMGYGLGGYSITDTGLTGLPASPGTYGWGGAASTDFLVDPEEELVAMVLTQLLPTGTYPLRPTMEVLTYQAIVD
ncbi:MAG: beta-lactamase family protein [Holophagales bacterium]|nr:beta-lactamase family protein [Holophagales bacterium]MYF94457.1 beta-lactamase family protein [Holophagales bacterium]